MFTQKKVMETKNEVAIRCYLDFDGTLSGLTGYDTINSHLYRSVKKNPNEDYATAEFIEEKEMLQKLREGFETDNKSMMVSSHAINFLKEMLKNNAEIYVISKNRKEWIKALLQIGGFRKEQIDKIIIKDINDLLSAGNKYRLICNNEFSLITKRAKFIVACDDFESDFNEMVSGLEEMRYDEKRRGYKAILGYNADTGKFDWNKIAEEVTQKAKEEPSQAPSQAPSVQ